MICKSCKLKLHLKKETQWCSPLTFTKWLLVESLDQLVSSIGLYSSVIINWSLQWNSNFVKQYHINDLKTMIFSNISPHLAILVWNCVGFISWHSSSKCWSNFSLYRYVTNVNAYCYFTNLWVLEFLHLSNKKKDFKICHRIIYILWFRNASSIEPKNKSVTFIPPPNPLSGQNT